MSGAAIDSSKHVVRIGYSAKEVAAMLGFSHNQVLYLAKHGRIPAQRIGRRWIVPAWFVRRIEREGVMPGVE